MAQKLAQKVVQNQSQNRPQSIELPPRAFEERGSRVSLPAADRRYSDTAALLLTSYMNLDRGLIPQYGAGKFYNEVVC